MHEYRRLCVILFFLLVASSIPSGLCWGEGLHIVIRGTDNSLYYCCRFNLDAEEMSYLTIINNNRSASTQAWNATSQQWVIVQKGSLSQLAWSQTLTVASEFHSQDMATYNYFNHTSLDGRTPIDRMRAAGYTYNTWLGENIAAGFETASSVFNAWYGSEGHKRNMLCIQYQAIGIGLAYNASTTYGWYWTTDFGGYDDSSQLWSAWKGLQGFASSAPTVVTSQGGRLYAVIRGTDNGVYYNMVVGGKWTGWTYLPGWTNDIPAVAVLDSRMHLVIRGTDSGIYHGYVDLLTRAWSSWTKIIGFTASSPALSTSSGVLHLVIRGTDNSIYYKYWNAGGGWSTWQQLPGTTNDIPAITTLGNNLHLVIRGTDNNIYHKMMDLSSKVWTSWISISGLTSSAPSIVAFGSDRLDLVIHGTDDMLYYKSWSPSGWSSTWQKIVGWTKDRPALAVTGNSLYLVIHGTDDGIYINTLDLSGITWAGWKKIPGGTISSPAATASNG